MARALTGREKRALRFGAVAVVAYLVLFYGSAGVRRLEEQRSRYTDMARAGDRLKFEVLQEQNKGRRLSALRSAYRIDLAALNKETVVGETREAIRKAAQAAGVGVSSFKELPGSSGAKHVATIQLSGAGPVMAALQFVHSLRSIGYPIVLERLSLEAARPGQVSFSLAAVLMDFTAYQSQEGAGA